MSELITFLNTIIPILVATNKISTYALLFVPLIGLLAKYFSFSWFNNIYKREEDVSVDIYSNEYRGDNWYDVLNEYYFSVCWYITNNCKLVNPTFRNENTVNKDNGDEDIHMIIPKYLLTKCDLITFDYNGNKFKAEIKESNDDKKKRGVIRISSSSFKVLDNFMIDCFKKYSRHLNNIDKSLRSFYFYKSDWIPKVIRINKTKGNVFLHKKVHNKIFDSIQTFLDSKDFYNKAGLAYKKGFLFYGEPGCGKSSSIYAIANFTQFEIYKLHLNSFPSAIKLREGISSIRSNSIVVVEDIDTINMSNNRVKKTIELTFAQFSQLDQRMKCNFNKAANSAYNQHDSSDEEDIDLPESPINEGNFQSYINLINRRFEERGTIFMDDISWNPYIKKSVKEQTVELISLGDLLEIFDGNEYLHSSIVIFTSNHPENIDPALIRSGRIDEKIKFKPADFEIVNDIMKYFYGRTIDLETLDDKQKKKLVSIKISQSKLINTYILPNINNFNKVLELLINH